MADHGDLEVVGEAAAGAEATRRITAGPTATRVLALTTFDEDDHV